MSRSVKAFLLAVVVAATVLVAGEVQAQDPPTQAPATQASGAVPFAIGGGTSEAAFVPLAPCRIYDTRQGQGGAPIGAGGVRGVKIRGGDDLPGRFAGQGGRAGGCGIPVGAVAVEATVTAVSAAGTGFLRLWPEGQPETSSTFLNYIRGFNPSNTGAMAICHTGCAAGSDLRVKAFNAATHVAIDVQGYYAAPLAAEVASNGNLLHGSRVISATKLFEGRYLVVFDRNVDQCVYSGDVDGQTGGGYAVVHQDTANDAGVRVSILGTDGLVTNRGFHLTVTC